MKKSIGVALVMAGVMAGMVALSGMYQTQAEEKAPPAKKPALQKFMRAKLELSQKILEGLVSEDFEVIEKNAQGLLLLAIAEEWKVSNDPLYTQHSQEFRRTVKQIGKMAKDQNLDGASLGFVQLTMGCIECHRFVRNQLVAGEK